MPEGVHPGVPRVIVLGHQVQPEDTGLRCEDEGEGSVVGDVVHDAHVLYGIEYVCLATFPHLSNIRH